MGKQRVYRYSQVLCVLNSITQSIIIRVQYTTPKKKKIPLVVTQLQFRIDLIHYLPISNKCTSFIGHVRYVLQVEFQETP